MLTKRSRWRVGLQADPITIHSWFVLTGLTALADDGTIELQPIARRVPPERSLWLEIEDRETNVKASISVDVTDPGPLEAPRRAALADLTWKRSFDRDLHAGERIVPFGLILGCCSGVERNRLAYLARLTRTNGPRATFAAIVAWRNAPPNVSEYEASPDVGDDVVLFQVRAWPEVGRDPADRRARNETRATLIRDLRAELGDSFRGGFVDTPYARQQFGDCISDLPDDPRSYLELVRSCRIGVSTQGLHGSNPYKLAEYLAAGRAIVSEPLRFDVPEPLQPGVHVVHFDDAPGAVEACRRLLDDPSRRAAMQHASTTMWRDTANPRDLVLRRLEELPANLG